MADISFSTLGVFMLLLVFVVLCIHIHQLLTNPRAQTDMLLGYLVQEIRSYTLLMNKPMAIGTTVVSIAHISWGLQVCIESGSMSVDLGWGGGLSQPLVIFKQDGNTKSIRHSQLENLTPFMQIVEQKLQSK